ncbi:MAG TPA: hypothetical protein VJL37_10690 [Flavobacterium sp.]|nr:hypothetical protein [Flavobacterium sp.]
MGRKFYLILLLIIFQKTEAQTEIDRIVITKKTYQPSSLSMDQRNTIYKSTEIKLTDKQQINDLAHHLSKFDNTERLLEKFEIDTAYILNNKEDLLKLYISNQKNSLDWNEKQKSFIYEKLSDLNNYKKALIKYLSVGNHYTMHNPYLNQYVITLYKNKSVINAFTSAKNRWGYHFPYTDLSGKKVYNYNVDKLIRTLFEEKSKVDEPKKGEDLLKYIVDKIIEENMQELYKLSAYSFQNEISELSSHFSILSTEEIYARGRYIWDESRTFKITLKTDSMLPNVYLQFLASEEKGTLYSRDSVKNEFKTIIDRVQSIPFITDYLKKDTSSTLDVYYFNNNSINEYNIDSVNKSPSEWKKHDEYMEGLKWYEQNNIKMSFNKDEAIKNSERNHCGCNYRYTTDFIKRAVFLEIESSLNPSSIWFLLPDDSLLLYHVGSYTPEEAIVLDKKLKQFDNNLQLPFSCLLFDKNGNSVNRK